MGASAWNWPLISFLLPFGYCVFSLVSRRLLPWPRFGLLWDWSPTTRSLLQIPIGIGLFVWGLSTIPGTAREARTYASDPACVQGTHLRDRTADSICRVEDATVSAIERRDNHNVSDYYFDVATSTGTRRVQIDDDVGSNRPVWNAVRASGPTPAKVQLVNGRAALIETSAGIAATEEQPATRLNLGECIAAAGVGLAGAALLELLLASFLLPAGW